ncbi:hypothetical protein QAD02_006791 [Eretmocerus hayati]|uniref:Uncharacterized protein n=1 Tax=Eretmocerus hayati TaxID=131215 RepID=A0ACC2N271_9HYME|nr:hypothetical protein QAD02_006791 [Eretmocerus hayati]
METTNSSSLNFLMAKTLSNDDFLANKENTEKENDPSIIDRTLLSISAKKVLGNNNNDYTVDRSSSARKGLRDLNSTADPNLTKKSSSSSSIQTNNKQWTKTSFNVHRDNLSNPKGKSLKTSSNVKKSKPQNPNLVLGGKTSTRKNNESVSTTVGQNNSEVSKMELLEVQNMPGTIFTPENSLPTQPINPPPVKEMHKAPKRTPKLAYDTLSLELAYNFEYMSEYVDFQASISHCEESLKHCFQKGVTCDLRRSVIKFLINFTITLEYPSFVLYQAVKIFDSHIKKAEVDIADLKPLALAALWIALKKDVTSNFEIPEASTIMKLDESVFNDKDKSLFKYEKMILETLNFNISFAEPSSMLALFTVMIEEVRDLDPEKVQALYYCGCYMIDLSLLHHQLHNISAITLAIISAEIALAIVMKLDESKLSTWSHWHQKLFNSNPGLEKYRLPNEKMTGIRDRLMSVVILSKDEKSDYHVVYQKYSKARYGQVSDLIVCTYFSSCIQNWSASPFLH